MAKVIVIARGKKFVVLVDYIQRGVAYATKAQAEKEAEAIRTRGTW